MAPREAAAPAVVVYMYRKFSHFTLYLEKILAMAMTLDPNEGGDMAKTPDTVEVTVPVMINLPTTLQAS